MTNTYPAAESADAVDAATLAQTEPQDDVATAGPASGETVLGWALRPSDDERCSACERMAPELHQGRYFIDRRWEDVPGLVLCVQCFHQRSTRRAPADSYWAPDR